MHTLVSLIVSYTISTSGYHLDNIVGTTQEEMELYDANGPLWYRGWALESEESVCTDVEHVLARTGTRRMIMGHTPDFNVGICLESRLAQVLTMYMLIGNCVSVQRKNYHNRHRHIPCVWRRALRFVDSLHPDTYRWGWRRRPTTVG